MIEFNLKTTRSEFLSLIYCAANINDYNCMEWIHRPERSDACFHAGSTIGTLVVWKGGKNIDFTIYGKNQGEGIHWNIELTDCTIKV